MLRSRDNGVGLYPAEAVAKLLDPDVAERRSIRQTVPVRQADVAAPGAVPERLEDIDIGSDDSGSIQGDVDTAFLAADLHGVPPATRPRNKLLGRNDPVDRA